MGAKRVQLGMAFDVGAGEPPTEFRLFRAGVNSTQKGDFIFDEQSAATVLAAWREWGVDLMIDLDHLSLDIDCSPRTDAGDARGWFGLELRGGELWAVNVRWTPDGERRLREKSQRYVSPAFRVDEDERVVEILNCAITATPATNDAAPLVAASKRSKRDPRMPAIAEALAIAISLARRTRARTTEKAR